MYDSMADELEKIAVKKPSLESILGRAKGIHAAAKKERKFRQAVSKDWRAIMGIEKKRRK